MKTGTVQWFNDKKGYGFIRPEGEDKDIFVHASGLIDVIKQDDEVEFEIGQRNGKQIAEDVVLLQSA